MPVASAVGDLEYAALTHRGRVRQRNEDAFLCDRRLLRFAVIDGMGGHGAGDVASAIACEALGETGDLVSGFVTANARILGKAAEAGTREVMGCVATAVDVRPDGLLLAHVGDSRAILVGADGCMQLTRQHTEAGEAQEAPDDGLSDGGRATHGVTRAIGTEALDDPSWVDTVQSELRPGDLLLLCSDGLTDMVPSPALFATLNEARQARTPLRQLVKGLVQAALAAGGRDNVTIVVLRRRTRAPWARWVRPFARHGAVVLAGGLVGWGTHVWVSTGWDGHGQAAPGSPANSPAAGDHEISLSRPGVPTPHPDAPACPPHVPGVVNLVPSTRGLHVCAWPGWPHDMALFMALTAPEPTVLRLRGGDGQPLLDLVPRVPAVGVPHDSPRAVDAPHDAVGSPSSAAGESPATVPPPSPADSSPAPEVPP